MPSKTRSILILLITLILGIVLGFIASTYHYHHRVHSFMRMTKEEGFTQVLQERLSLSKDQKEEVLPILKEYAQKNVEFHKECREQHLSLLDSLKSELRPHLDKEQMETLNDQFRCGESCQPRGEHPH